MDGPGYRDFNYTEAYAPIYDYITPDSPELWRRSIYRFVVRSTVQPLMTTLDCPNPANLTPARIVTTTALQSLALMNNDFMLRQADHFARRIERETGVEKKAQVRRAFALALAMTSGDEDVERDHRRSLAGVGHDLALAIEHQRADLLGRRCHDERAL